MWLCYSLQTLLIWSPIHCIMLISVWNVRAEILRPGFRLAKSLKRVSNAFCHLVKMVDISDQKYTFACVVYNSRWWKRTYSQIKVETKYRIKGSPLQKYVKIYPTYTTFIIPGVLLFLNLHNPLSSCKNRGPTCIPNF